MSATPYISFVTYGRNDGYTPSYVRRVSRATTCLARQLDRAEIDAEIIITDWNSPPDRPHLIDVLDLPKALRHVTVRGIIVDPKHHSCFIGAGERGLHAGEAGNAGIRRARGRFITTKASDTFLSPPTIAQLARRDLDEDTVYRIDRHDVVIDDDAILAADDDTLLAALQRLPSVRHASIREPEQFRLRELHTNACGDFTLMSRRHWHRLRGHPQDATVLALDLDSLVLHAAAALGVRECRWPDDCRVYKPAHGNLNGARVSEVWTGWQRVLDKFLSYWVTPVSPLAPLRARILFDYPRRKVRGVDSVIGPSFERNLVDPASRWLLGEPPAPWQPEDWGLANVALEERVLCKADWETVAAA